MINKTANAQFFQIFSFINANETAIVANVCRLWKKLSDNEVVWKTVFKGTFPTFIMKTNPLSYKVLFRATALSLNNDCTLSVAELELH